MKRITFVPGAVVSPAAITIPTDVPDIDLVLAAEITRIPAAQAAHAHDLIYAGGPAANAVTMAADSLANATANPLTVAGGSAVTGGVQNSAALTGANPVVAAVATKVTTRTISLSVNTALGDLLTLDYIEAGARVPTS